MGDEAVQMLDRVWDALEETPEAAAPTRLRSGLAIALREVVDSRGVSQTEATRRLGVTHPRLNDLLRARGSVQFGGVDWAGGAGWAGGSGGAFKGRCFIGRMAGVSR